MGKDSGTQTVTQTNEPWEPLQAPLQGYFGAANDWFYGPQGNPYTNTPAWQGQGQPGAGTTGVAPPAGSGQLVENVFSSHPISNIQADPGNVWAQDEYGMYVQRPATTTDYVGGTAGSAENQTAPIPYGDRTSWMNQQMVAGLDPLTLEAWDRATTRARSGSDVLRGAQNLTERSLAGDFLNSNPSLGYFQNAADWSMANPAMALFAPTATGEFLNQENPAFQAGANRIGQAFREQIMPGIESRFSLSGRTGSGAEQDAYSNASRGVSDSLGSLWGDIYNQERNRQLTAASQLGGFYSTGLNQYMQAAQGISDPYERERQRMLGYAGMAPGLAEADYNDIARLESIGRGREADAQRRIDAPLQRLQQYGALFSPGSGYGTQTGVQPLYSNPMGGALGGAGLGAGIGALAGATGAAGFAPYLLGGAALGYASGKS